MSRRFEDRSRSPPRRNSKEWIAKTIVRFGRYEDRRPRGLSVDGTGAMLLSNLMRVWGEEEGLPPKKVLEALQENQRQADGGTRFSVDRLGDDWEITVHPRHRMGGDRPRPRRPHSREADRDGNFSTKDKMGMGLDDIIRGSSSRDHYSSRDHHRSSRDDCKPGAGHGVNGAASNCKVEVDVIDLEDDNFDLAALAPPAPPAHRSFASTGWAKRREIDERDRMDWHHRPHDERDRTDRPHRPFNQQDHQHKVKVSKFVSYILKRGHAELGIDLWQEFADLNDIVKILNQKRHMFGEYTLEDLKNSLQDSDDVGRFKFWKDWVRKIDRSDRDAPKSSAAPVGMEVDRSHDPGRAPSSDVSRPPGPPGEFWTQYTDEGQGKTWWFYEGPLGKWWCDDDDAVPRVWNFDD